MLCQQGESIFQNLVIALRANNNRQIVEWTKKEIEHKRVCAICSGKQRAGYYAQKYKVMEAPPLEDQLFRKTKKQVKIRG